MVRVHGQVMGRILWKCKRMFRILFRPLPTVLPRGNSLLPLKIRTHPRRDCSLSFGNPLAFPSCPSSTLLLPLSSAGSLDCFPVWTVPGRTPLGEQRACWPSFFFSGEARLIQLHWQAVFPRRVAKHVGPLLRELRQHSVMEKPFKSVSSEPPEEARADSRTFFFNQPQEPPNNSQSSVSSCLWKFKSSNLLRANFAFLVVPPKIMLQACDTHMHRSTSPWTWFRSLDLYNGTSLAT